jgi:ribosome-binding protein aMBF1 (putative translation factor)
MTKTKTSDALEIIHRRFLKDKPESQELLREISLNARVAQLIYNARKAKGLTQKELADLIQTKQSVLARLEDADYEGHSLSMLHRISEALQQRVEISIVPTETTPPQSLSLLDNLPARLIEARKAMGMTPKELGVKVGMSEQEIEDHEVSLYASISFDRLRKIVEVLAIQTYA